MFCITQSLALFAHSSAAWSYIGIFLREGMSILATSLFGILRRKVIPSHCVFTTRDRLKMGWIATACRSASSGLHVIKLQAIWYLTYAVIVDYPMYEPLLFSIKDTTVSVLVNPATVDPACCIRINDDSLANSIGNALMNNHWQ